MGRTVNGHEPIKQAPRVDRKGQLLRLIVYECFRLRPDARTRARKEESGMTQIVSQIGNIAWFYVEFDLDGKRRLGNVSFVLILNGRPPLKGGESVILPCCTLLASVQSLSAL
jgi:hypothetical protein